MREKPPALAGFILGVCHVDHARDGLLVQEVVAGKFGYGAPVEHATPLKSIRSYQTVRTEF